MIALTAQGDHKCEETCWKLLQNSTTSSDTSSGLCIGPSPEPAPDPPRNPLLRALEPTRNPLRTRLAGDPKHSAPKEIKDAVPIRKAHRQLPIAWIQVDVEQARLQDLVRWTIPIESCWPASFCRTCRLLLFKGTTSESLQGYEPHGSCQDLALLQKLWCRALRGRNPRTALSGCSGARCWSSPERRQHPALDGSWHSVHGPWLARNFFSEAQACIPLCHSETCPQKHLKM